jgi:hypothetical protein
MSVFFNIVLFSDFGPFGRAASKAVTSLMRLRRKPSEKSKNFGACQVASYKSPLHPSHAKMQWDDENQRPRNCFANVESLKRKSLNRCAVALGTKSNRCRVGFGEWRVDLKPALGGVDASSPKHCVRNTLSQFVMSVRDSPITIHDL